MRVRRLLTDDEAVSPVIGVVLMVAITVILAAVIGTFVFQLGEEAQQTSPQASFTFDISADGAGSYNVTATHDGGDVITTDDSQNVTLGAGDGSGPATFTGGLPVTVSDSATLTGVSNDTSVRVKWVNADGQRAATLARTETPE